MSHQLGRSEPRQDTPGTSDRFDDEGRAGMQHRYIRRTARAPRRYQTLSTTIADGRSGAEAGFQVYPTDPLDGPSPRPGRRDPPALVPLPAELEWQAAPSYVEPAQEERAIALANSLIPDAETRQAAALPPDVLQFARYLVREPVLPFRRNPIEGETLADCWSRRQVRAAA